MRQKSSLKLLSPWMREFMQAVFGILASYSYRSGQMQEILAADNKKPDGVRAIDQARESAKKVAVENFPDRPLASIP